MEVINCPVCQSTEYSPYLKTWDRFDPTRQTKFELVQCQKCNFVFLNPRPNEQEIAHYYTADNYDPFISLEADPSLRSRLYAAIRRSNLNWKARQIRKITGPGTLLDYGCATGEFIAQMIGYGWQGYGLEVDQKARRFACDRGLNVVATTNQLSADISYDVITLWHVLEHINELHKALKFFTEHLVKNGYLIIAVPNLESSDFKKYRHKWIALDTPRHLYHFTQASIEHLLQPYGLHLEKRIPLIFDTFYNHFMTNAIIHRPISGFINSIAGIGGTLFRTWLISINAASTLVYFFKKG